MNERITLVEAARKIEESGLKIQIGKFEDFEQFLLYWNAHYKPIIEKLAEEWAMATDARRFLTEDLLSAFADGE